MTTLRQEVAPSPVLQTTAPRSWEGVIFYIMVALSVLPVWGVAYFPSNDGPEHLHNAYVLLHLNAPDGAIFRSYYQINPALSPNWAGHLVLALLMSVLPALGAEKVLLSAYLISLPLATRYALGAIRPGARYLAVLAFPLAYNWCFHMGFYNFCFSLSVYVLAVGYFLKYRGNMARPGRAGWAAWGRVAGLAGILLGLYFCHLSGVVMAMGVIGGLTVWQTAVDWRTSARRRGVSDAGESEPDRPPPAWGRWRVLAAFVPVLALVAVFFVQNTEHEGISPELGLASRLKLVLTFLRAFARVEATFGAVLLALLLLLVMGGHWRLWRRQALSPDRSPDRAAPAHITPAFRWGLGLAIASLVLLGLLLPSNVGRGGFILQRLVLFTVLLGVLYVGTLPVGQLLSRMVWSLTVVFSVLLWGYYHHRYGTISDYVAEYVSVGRAIPDNSTVMPIAYELNARTPRGAPLSDEVNPFRHIAGYLGANRPLVDLDNYEGEVGYFPIIWRAAVNPFRLLREDLDFRAYPARTGYQGRVDYVLIWTGGTTSPPDERARRLQAWLEEDFQEVYVSAPRGYARLWRKR